jgi:hypothetical protein
MAMDNGLTLVGDPEAVTIDDLSVGGPWWQHDKDLRPNMTHTRQALRDQLEPFAAPAP